MGTDVDKGPRPKRVKFADPKRVKFADPLAESTDVDKGPHPMCYEEKVSMSADMARLGGCDLCTVVRILRKHASHQIRDTPLEVEMDLTKLDDEVLWRLHN